MKSKQLNIGLLVLAVLLTVSMNSLAQRGPRMGGNSWGCLNLPGLTEKQKTEIAALNQQHRKEMDEIRTTWRQSASFAAGETHRSEVNKKVTEHRQAVRNLLNDDQKAAFDSIRRSGGRALAMTGRNGKACGTVCQRGGRHTGRMGRNWNDSNEL